MDRAERLRLNKKNRLVKEPTRQQERCKRCKGLFRYGTLDDDFLCADCAQARLTEKVQWEDVPLFDEQGANDDGTTEAT